MAAKHDGDDLTAGQTNHEQSGFELVADPNEDGKFGGNYILQVVLSDGLFSSTPQIDGVKALVRDGRGVHGHSIENDGVVGTSGASNRTSHPSHHGQHQSAGSSTST